MHVGRNPRGVIQRAGFDEDIAGIGVAFEMYSRPAFRARPSMHVFAGIAHHHIIRQLAGDLKTRIRDHEFYEKRTAGRALAIVAVTEKCELWFFRD